MMAAVQTARSIADVRSAVADAKAGDDRVGCVMTMGALHAGHRSLMAAARADCGFVVATIFVNPTQFGPGEDFDRYPRTEADDLSACEAEGVDLAFLPPVEVMYPPAADTRVVVGKVARPLEGRHRPGHFEGVATVVLKLLNIVQPDAAYFGQKDYQQVAVIRRMVADLDVPTDVVTRPTLREPDGLAMSSRNRYLSADERAAALAISRSLREAAERLRAGETNVDLVRQSMWAAMSADDLVRVQYASVADADTLKELTEARPRMVVSAAARVGGTRLIDNMTVDLTDAGDAA